MGLAARSAWNVDCAPSYNPYSYLLSALCDKNKRDKFFRAIDYSFRRKLKICGGSEMITGGFGGQNAVGILFIIFAPNIYHL